MSIIIKTKEEIEILREGGRRLATVLNKVKEVIQPGISTYELDKYAEQLIREYGDEPAFLITNQKAQKFHFRPAYVFQSTRK